MNRQPFTFLALGFGHACDHYFMLIFPTAALALEREWQASYAEILALGTPAFVAMAAGGLPAGWLGDRWSRTGMIALFFLGLGAAAILAGLARSPWELAAALGLLGLFASIYHPVGTAMVVQTARRTGRALGLIGVSGNLGVALAPVCTGLLTALAGWRAAFILPGLLALAVGAAVLPLVRRAPGPARPAAAQPQAAPAAPGDQRRVLLVVAIAALFLGLVFNAVTTALPKLFEERLPDLGGGMLGVGALVSAVLGVAALAQILVGHLIDRYAVKRVFLALLGLQVLLLLLVAGASGLWLLLLSVPLMLVVFGEIPIGDWLVGRYTAGTWRSRVYAVKYVLSLGVGAAAIPMVAVFHDSAGGFAALLVTLAALAGGVLAAALMLPGGKAARGGASVAIAGPGAKPAE